jgi:DeoR family glycerol-3-phosphate regulon repressor
VRHAILSIAAINERGFMLQDMEEAEFSREAAKIAENRIVVADAEKFGRAAPIMVDMPDMLVTNAAPPEDIRTLIEGNGIDLIVAGSREQA